MAANESFEKFKQQWADMEQSYKIAIGAILVGGVILIMVKGKEHDELVKQAEATKAAQVTQASAANTNSAIPFNNGMSMSTIPQSTRNQGLEDMKIQLEKTTADAKRSEDAAHNAETLVRKMSDRLQALEEKKPGVDSNTGAVNLNESLPPPVDFSQPAGALKPVSASNGPDVSLGHPFANTGESFPLKPSRPSMQVWESEKKPGIDKKKIDLPVISIPVYSAIESVMLTGINARSNASGGGAAGSVLSANSVGAPFVTRVKGSAILPNGWKNNKLSDCFIGGNGIAILSSERANVIANRISCIDKKGEIYEGDIKAYGVDLDGIQGISGRVVTKQGAILAKTFMAGIASGLGSALSPTAVPGYNSNQQSGQQQGIQYPNMSLVAQSGLGTGFSTAAGQLSKFYLDYAKEMFPVIEVDAGTRITWILQETVELTMTPNTSTVTTARQ